MENTNGNWVHLGGDEWSHLLQYQPRFADKCDWEKLDGHNWTHLLIRQPSFADKCDWSKLDGWCWAQLLAAHTEFADKCDWEKLSASDWYTLVYRRPEFAEKCDMSKFKGDDIVRLFREKNRISPAGLYGRIDECDFSTLSASDWSEILALRPDLVDKFEASTHDWLADTEEDPEEVLPEEEP